MYDAENVESKFSRTLKNHTERQCTECPKKTRNTDVWQTVT